MYSLAWRTRIYSQKLTNPVHKGDDDFGAHVSLSGNGKKLLVAAPNWPNGGDQGILYMYEYHNGAWILQVPVEKHSAIGGGNPDYYLGYGYASGGSAALSRDGNVIFGGELGYNSGVGRVRAWVSPGTVSYTHLTLPTKA